jgi:hypothetical protein
MHATRWSALLHPCCLAPLFSQRNPLAEPLHAPVRPQWPYSQDAPLVPQLHTARLALCNQLLATKQTPATHRSRSASCSGLRPAAGSQSCAVYLTLTPDAQACVFLLCRKHTACRTHHTPHIPDHVPPPSEATSTAHSTLVFHANHPPATPRCDATVTAHSTLFSPCEPSPLLPDPCCKTVAAHRSRSASCSGPRPGAGSQSCAVYLTLTPDAQECACLLRRKHSACHCTTHQTAPIITPPRDAAITSNSTLAFPCEPTPCYKTNNSRSPLKVCQLLRPQACSRVPVLRCIHHATAPDAQACAVLLCRQHTACRTHDTLNSPDRTSTQ